MNDRVTAMGTSIFEVEPEHEQLVEFDWDAQLREFLIFMAMLPLLAALFTGAWLLLP